jgi:hypothetical protein
LRATVYEILGLGFLLGSAAFFWRTIEFLAQRDYVAGVVALIVGFLVSRAGVEISKLALVIRREEGAPRGDTK